MSSEKRQWKGKILHLKIRWVKPSLNQDLLLKTVVLKVVPHQEMDLLWAVPQWVVHQIAVLQIVVLHQVCVKVRLQVCAKALHPMGEVLHQACVKALQEVFLQAVVLQVVALQAVLLQTCGQAALHQTTETQGTYLAIR